MAQQDSKTATAAKQSPSPFGKRRGFSHSDLARPAKQAAQAKPDKPAKNPKNPLEIKKRPPHIL